jgi:hypothetical protein
MSTVEDIRRLGFRKWYERRLIEGHAWLVSLVLSLLVSAAGFELLDLRGAPAQWLSDATLVIGGAAFAGLSWQRYATALGLAEHVARQAQCPACGRHGFRALPGAVGAARARLQVACRGCGHGWEVDPGAP